MSVFCCCGFCRYERTYISLSDIVNLGKFSLLCSLPEIDSVAREPTVFSHVSGECPSLKRIVAIKITLSEILVFFVYTFVCNLFFLHDKNFQDSVQNQYLTIKYSADSTLATYVLWLHCLMTLVR